VEKFTWAKKAERAKTRAIHFELDAIREEDEEEEEEEVLVGLSD